ncbi:hypothetical protein, partial [Aeromonas caviae]|uniref:hypothetical protein n=1 Tax=Aeromonas caviae TaxID=648 RepID=UPI00301518C9
MRNIYQEKRIDRLKTQGIKHEVTTCITCPSTTPNPIASYIGVMTPAFFKIVVAQSCFKQPLFAPARVSRAAPDLASRH